MVLFGDQEVASQAYGVNDDGVIDELFFVESFGANANRELTLKLGLSLINNRNYPKSTHAELSKRFGGIKTAQAFLEHLDETIKKLESPLEITVAATSHPLISHLVFQVYGALH